MFYFDSWNIFVYRVKAWRAGASSVRRAGLLAELSVNIRMGKRNGEWAPGYQGGNKYSSGFFPEMMRVTAPVAAVPERQGLPLEKPCRGNVPCAPARLPAVPHYSAWFSSAHFLYCADSCSISGWCLEARFFCSVLSLMSYTCQGPRLGATSLNWLVRAARFLWCSQKMVREGQVPGM